MTAASASVPGRDRDRLQVAAGRAAGIEPAPPDSTRARACGRGTAARAGRRRASSRSSCSPHRAGHASTHSSRSPKVRRRRCRSSASRSPAPARARPRRRQARAGRAARGSARGAPSSRRAGGRPRRLLEQERLVLAGQRAQHRVLTALAVDQSPPGSGDVDVRSPLLRRLREASARRARRRR